VVENEHTRGKGVGVRGRELGPLVPPPELAMLLLPIDARLRKWLARLPHPFTAADRAAGYHYDIAILQAGHKKEHPLCHF
jgi:hypothetical protein